MQAARQMQGVELTAAQVAELMRCDTRSVQRLVAGGKLAGEKRPNERNRPTYYIPLDALDAKLQARYYKGHSKQAVAVEFPQQAKPMEGYSLDEQRLIAFWTGLLKEWNDYRYSRQQVPKGEADAQFVTYATVRYQQDYQDLTGREFKLSVQTIYRRWAAHKANDMDGLLDRRGKAKKGRSAIPQKIWDAFLYYYLDQAQHPISSCYEYTRLWILEKHPELYEDIPSVDCFYRRVNNEIPEAVKVLARQGEKAYRDRCGLYIRREYDGMESNDYWVADTHTLDVISNDEDGRQHRLYLSAFFDARSGIFTGCHISDTPGSQPVLLALRKGILKYGIPKNIYVDNGREFLNHDLGGLGHRAKKKHANEFTPPPIFERLGINMVNALVRNARAKVIERRFRDVKDHLSRLFPTYTGGNVVERPEQLKYNLKAGRIIADRELTEQVETILEYYFNERPYGGAVVADRGKPRTKVYSENLHTKRVASPDDLNLLLMRSSRVQTVGRRGVNYRLGSLKLDYWNDELVTMLQGQKVYYRYDPEDLSEVRIYDLEDRLLTVAPLDTEMTLAQGVSKDELQQALRHQRKTERAVATLMEAMKQRGGVDMTAAELILQQAERNKAAGTYPLSPKVLELQRELEKPLLEAAVGLDINTMVRNAELFNQGGNT